MYIILQKVEAVAQTSVWAFAWRVRSAVKAVGIWLNDDTTFELNIRVMNAMRYIIDRLT